MKRSDKWVYKLLVYLVFLVQGLKEYSCWPTYPQLYVKGELVGGCDIVLELHSKGELQQTIKTKQHA